MAELKKTVLIAEDELNSRTFLRDILTEAGFEVWEAADGLAALDVIQKRKPDLLITDRVMPRLGGLELLEKLKENHLSLPSLMMSVYGEEAAWGKALALGAQDYLIKPFQAKDVIKVVTQILGRKNP